MAFPPGPLVQIQINFTEMFLMMSQNCTNGFGVLSKGAARALDKKYFKKASTEPLVGIQNDFAEMFRVMFSTKLHKWFCSIEQMGFQSSR